MTLISKKHQRFGLYFVTVGLTLLMVGRLISRRYLPSVVGQGSGIPGAVKVLKNYNCHVIAVFLTYIYLFMNFELLMKFSGENTGDFKSRQL